MVADDGSNCGDSIGGAQAASDSSAGPRRLNLPSRSRGASGSALCRGSGDSTLLSALLLGKRAATAAVFDDTATAELL